MHTVTDIDNWFSLAIPEPTDKNRAVQVGVHFEEFSEMLDALSLTKTAVHVAVKDKADSLKKEGSIAIDASYIDLQELLDAMVDQVVTAMGVGYMFDFDMLGAIDEISRSNYSKFVDGKPIFDANGKIAKGPNYFKADLTKFLKKPRRIDTTQIAMNEKKF